jgi:hypothetical protein
MAEQDAEQLAQAEDVPLYRAEKALNLEDGDYEQARKRLREAPVAVKCRFASQNNDIYGLFLVMINVTPPNLDSLSVLVGNHRGIGNVKLSLSHTEFLESIDRLEQEKGKMTALSEQLEEGLQGAFSPPSNEWMELINNREELSIQEQLDQLIAESIEEDELITTVSLETGLIEGEESDEGEAVSEEVPEDEEGVQLLCDVRVSPVRGKPVADINVGEQIYVTVKDDQRDEHGRLIDVIDRLRDDDLGMVPVPVREVNRTNTGKLEFIVQFGENVNGRVLAGEDMNIMTPSSVSHEDDGDLLDSAIVWFLLFVVIMVIGISILYGLIGGF